MRSWVIGSGIDCDVVVDSPLASARHSELTQTPEGFVLNDLGSTNGTYVNGVRMAGPTRLNAGDSITLGRTVPFPWPSELTTSIAIGRLADNDIVLDDPRVSGHHARLLVLSGFQAVIEDLGSSNGTFLNSADRRVTSPTPITELDTLYFGTLAVPAARLLRSLRPPMTQAPAQLPTTAVTEPPAVSPAASPLLAFWHQNRLLLVWSGQAPALAALIALVFGRPVATANGQSIAQGIAATTFALALAAIWSGCSLAVAEVAARHAPFRDGKRLGGLFVLCAMACAVVLAVVYWGSGLKGPWLAMWGVLTVSSLVGLFLGLAVSAPVRNWVAVASVLLLCVVTMIALGGWIWPLATMSPPVRVLAEAVPSRWAFEGLLLLEAAQHSAPAPSDDADPDPDDDFVDAYFPAATERMGPAADALALGSMLIGLAALAVFLSAGSRAVP